MGAAPSTGTNNDELIDCLVDSNYIRFRSSELAFRLVDRGDYFPSDKRDKAYTDQAWKSDHGMPGFIHLSAPCIYANALEYLDLRPGLSFLNIGSGTGYFNALAGFLLTESGINHGVEMYENVVEYAQENLQTIIKRPAISAFGFCVPEFFVGSAFYVQNGMEYDRIYCGALVPKNRRFYFCNMLKIGGILVMPYASRLLQIIRKDKYKFLVYQISNVAFSSLITPSETLQCSSRVCELPQFEVPSLIQLCRAAIRSHIRRNLFSTNPIQMQFEIGLTKETDEQQESEEQQMERIGTLYFMNRHDRNPPQQQNAQAAENEEALLDNTEAANETPDAIQGPLNIPPVEEPQNNNENGHQEDQANIPMEDGIDAEAAAALENENQAQQEDREEEARNQPVQQRAEEAQIHRIAVQINGVQQNAAQMANQLQQRRLHVNLINGNRLVGFLNQDGDDENESDEEDLFREANNRRDPAEPIGLAVSDKVTSAVFHTTDVRPSSLDSVNMTQLIPNYKPPQKKRRAKSISGCDTRDASTVTDDIRIRPNRFALRLAVRPVQQRQAGPARNQPSTSAESTNTQTVAETQTEENEILPAQEVQRPPQEQAHRRLNVARQILHGIHQNIDAIQTRQTRIRQLFDRMQRFTNAVHQVPPNTAESTTAATANSTASQSTSASQSSSRTGTKRKFEDDSEIHSDTAETNADSMPKISRSASLPDVSHDQQVNTVDLMSSLLIPQPSHQSQSSSLRPDSPLQSSSISAFGDPPSPLSTVSSENSSIPTISTSGQTSDALSDATSGGDLSSIAGGSSASSAPRTATTIDSESSGFATDDQQESSEDSKRQSERAERSRVYKKQIEDFHTEFQRRLKLLPLSEHLIRYLCYD